jgi:hypothetical protein
MKQKTMPSRSFGKRCNAAEPINSPVCEVLGELGKFSFNSAQAYGSLWIVYIKHFLFSRGS